MPKLDKPYQKPFSSKKQSIAFLSKKTMDKKTTFFKLL